MQTEREVLKEQVRQLRDENSKLRRRLENCEKLLNTEREINNESDNDDEVSARLDTFQHVLSRLRDISENPYLPWVVALRLGYDPFAPGMERRGEDKLSSKEIAERLRISEGRVTQLYNEGLDILRINKDIQERLLHNHPELEARLKLAERKDRRE